MELTPEELRVLGCLVEKSHTTPEHYPLTTNALVSACNQKSSREPIVSYSARQVDEISTELRKRGLVRTVRGTGMRTHKHKHVIDEALGLSDQEQAILAVLMLRGPQSPGELKTRTDRYVSFPDLSAVEQVLADLASKAVPMVANVGRGSGQAQDRWRHTLQTEAEMVAAQMVEERALAADLSHGLAPVQDLNARSTVEGTAFPTAAAGAAPTGQTMVTESPALEARIQALEDRVSFLEQALGVDPSEATFSP